MDVNILKDVVQNKMKGVMLEQNIVSRLIDKQKSIKINARQKQEELLLNTNRSATSKNQVGRNEDPRKAVAFWTEDVEMDSCRHSIRDVSEQY